MFVHATPTCTLQLRQGAHSLNTCALGTLSTLSRLALPQSQVSKVPSEDVVPGLCARLESGLGCCRESRAAPLGAE